MHGNSIIRIKTINSLSILNITKILSNIVKTRRESAAEVLSFASAKNENANCKVQILNKPDP